MPQLAIGTTGSEVLPRNPYRRSIQFHNASNNVIYVDTIPKGGITITNAGIKIPAGSTRGYDWVADGSKEITDAWAAVADVADSTLIYKEFGGAEKTVDLEKGLKVTKVTP